MTEMEYSLNDLINGDKAGTKPRSIIKVVDKNNRNESLVEKYSKEIEIEKEKEVKDKVLIGSSKDRQESLTSLLGGTI